MIEFIVIYVVIAFGFIVANAMVGGYVGQVLGGRDYLDALVWPVSLATLAGMTLRYVVVKIKQSNTTARSVITQKAKEKIDQTEKELKIKRAANKKLEDATKGL
jgi:hypothetical protein